MLADLLVDVITKTNFKVWIFVFFVYILFNTAFYLDIIGKLDNTVDNINGVLSDKGVLISAILFTFIVGIGELVL